MDKRSTLDENEIAALLESLCERPFGGDPEGWPPAMQAIAGRAARAREHAGEEQSGSAADRAQSGRAENPGRVTAELASILSGAATYAQCHGFREAAVASSAVRLEAQSALAFIDGIERAPLAAPAYLVEQVLASAGGAPLASKPGVWARLSGSRLGARRGRVAAACAVMLMAGGLSWSLLFRPADLGPGGAAVPVATNPDEETPIGGIGPQPALAPAAPTIPTPAPAAPTSALAPEPAPAPAAAQVLADPCEPRSFATSQAGARSAVESKAAKPAPNRQSKTAAVSAPEPACAGNGGASEAARNPQADHGPVRADRPAAKVGRLDRGPAAATASAPASAPYPGAAFPALPAMHPGAVGQPR